MTKFKLSFEKEYERKILGRVSSFQKKIIAKNLDTKEKVVIGNYSSEIRWYRPDGSRSRLATKQRRFWDLSWSGAGLSHIFGQKVDVYRYGDISAFYNAISSFTLKDVATYLNELAKRKDVNVRFE